MKRFVSGWDLLILLGAVAIAVQGWRHGATVPQAVIHGLTPLALGIGALRAFATDHTTSKTTKATGRKGGKK